MGYSGNCAENIAGRVVWVLSFISDERQECQVYDIYSSWVRAVQYLTSNGYSQQRDGSWINPDDYIGYFVLEEMRIK